MPSKCIYTLDPQNAFPMRLYTLLNRRTHHCKTKTLITTNCHNRVRAPHGVIARFRASDSTPNPTPIYRVHIQAPTLPVKKCTYTDRLSVFPIRSAHQQHMRHTQTKHTYVLYISPTYMHLQNRVVFVVRVSLNARCT